MACERRSGDAQSQFNGATTVRIIRIVDLGRLPGRRSISRLVDMVSEHDLFDPQPVAVVSDDEGGVRYLQAYIEPGVARQWYQSLLRNVNWTSHRRRMYERGHSPLQCTR
jgi:hypothetical protein